MQASANGLSIEYDTFGHPSDPTVLLIMGLGTQMIAWHPDFCNGLAERGFYVIRFDNRDVGLSQKIEGGKVDLPALLLESVSGGLPSVPYTLSDMAADAAGLLSTLDLQRAHIVGASMGGMIAQQFALDYPERVRNVDLDYVDNGRSECRSGGTRSLCSTVPGSPAEREAAIEGGVASRRITSPFYFDDAEADGSLPRRMTAPSIRKAQVDSSPPYLALATGPNS